MHILPIDSAEDGVIITLLQIEVITVIHIVLRIRLFLCNPYSYYFLTRKHSIVREIISNHLSEHGLNVEPSMWPEHPVNTRREIILHKLEFPQQIQESILETIGRTQQNSNRIILSRLFTDIHKPNTQISSSIIYESCNLSLLYIIYFISREKNSNLDRDSNLGPPEVRIPVQV